MTDKPTGLALLREPFAQSQISKLPKPTKAQTDALKSDFKTGMRCKECGQWHHRDVVHLDYVGHAALTHRLLDCDIAWNWLPMSHAPDGTPALDKNGGMWISLTVCGVTRLGYGHADGKSGGDAIKEVIGDALRNAAMRFGAALDLWHKGDLHAEDDMDQKRDAIDGTHEVAVGSACVMLSSADSLDDLAGVWRTLAKPVQADTRVIAEKDKRKDELKNADMGGDEIPYQGASK